MKLHNYWLCRLAGEVPDPWAATTEDLQAFLSVESWAPETRKSARAAVRGFYGWALDARRVRKDPSARLRPVRVPPGVPRPTPEKVLRAALSSAGERMGLMLRLAAFAGLRAAEIARVHSGDLVGDVLRVHGKGGKAREVPITSPDLLARLRAVDDRNTPIAKDRSAVQTALTGRNQKMNEHPDPSREAAEGIDCARAAENAIQQLCRATSARPAMTPAQVATALAHLADAVAALPQAARQLGDILEQAKDDHVLEMDALTETEDADLAIDTARLNLDAVHGPAPNLYRRLAAAHQETAHIAIAHPPASDSDEHAPGRAIPHRRPEQREPPPTAPGQLGPGHPR